MAAVFTATCSKTHRHPGCVGPVPYDGAGCCTKLEVPGKTRPEALPASRTLSGLDVLIFHASPQSLNEDIVDPPPLAVHADRHPVRLEYVGERLGGELCANGRC